MRSWRNQLNLESTTYLLSVPYGSPTPPASTIIRSIGFCGDIRHNGDGRTDDPTEESRRTVSPGRVAHAGRVYDDRAPDRT